MRPERIVHIGLGNFFKAHQAWYTDQATDSEDWGIVAYTGRSPKAAEDLNEAGLCFPMLTRYPDRDETTQVCSVVRAEPASNLDDFLKTMANPEIALVTMTITEAGYFASQLVDLQSHALGRLVLGLEARFRNGAAPLALVPCDNMPSNAKVLREALLKLGSSRGKDFVSYLDSLSYVSTSVDRITPATSMEEATLADGKKANLHPAGVITEPFSDWILEGDFPLGRPNWEAAGARFVTDIEPFENRKLWLLNGAHTLIALVGTELGYRTVDKAFADPKISGLVETWWDEACSQLPGGLELEQYRANLKARFSNPRMSDSLSRILQETTTKITARLAPVALSLLRVGRVSLGSTEAIAAFVRLAEKRSFVDAKSRELEVAISSEDPIASIIKTISADLAANDAFTQCVRDLVDRKQELVVGN